MKNSKPKRPQSLRIINFFFSSVFPFCYFCLVKAGFGTSRAHICRWEHRHRPPNTKEPASAEPQLQVVPALLPSHPPASQLPFHQPGCLVRCRVTSDLFQITVCRLPLSGKVMQWQDDVQRVHVSFIRIVYLLSLWIRTIYFNWFPAKSTGLSFSERSQEWSGTPKCVYSSIAARPRLLLQDPIRYISLTQPPEAQRTYAHI